MELVLNLEYNAFYSENRTFVAKERNRRNRARQRKERDFTCSHFVHLTLIRFHFLLISGIYFYRYFTAEVHKDRSLCGVKRHGLGVLRLGAFVELFLDIWFLEGWIVRGLG